MLFRSVPPEILERSVEIPDLGTMTVEEWTPLILGHAIGHVDQAVEILVDREVLSADEAGTSGSGDSGDSSDSGSSDSGSSDPKDGEES